MHPGRRNAIAFVALAAASVAAAEVWRPRSRLVETRAAIRLETVFPKSFGDWRVDASQPVQLVSPDTQAQLDRIYNQTLSRTYVDSQGERMMLSVAYGGDQSDAMRTHRPEVCYPAQGFQVTASSVGAVQLADGGALPVRRLVTNQGNRSEPLTYWVIVGEQVALSGTQQKLAQLRYSVRGVIPDGMLVRVSSIDRDTDRALRLQAGFVKDMAGALDAAWRARIVGANPVK